MRATFCTKWISTFKLSNFSWAKLNANQFEERILLINIRFGTWKVRRLNWTLVLVAQNLERLTGGQNFAGSSPSEIRTWRTFTYHIREIINWISIVSHVTISNAPATKYKNISYIRDHMWRAILNALSYCIEVHPRFLKYRQ